MVIHTSNAACVLTQFHAPSLSLHKVLLYAGRALDYRKVIDDFVAKTKDL